MHPIQLTSHVRLELAVLELKEKQIQGVNVAWTNLLSRVSHEKYIWMTARTHRRDVETVKSRLEVSTSSSSASEVMLTARVWIVGNNQGKEGPSSGGR